MPKLYELMARAQMHGALREPGYRFTLEDGEKGPHRTVVASNHGAQVANQDAVGGVVDEPLYREVTERVTEPIEARHERERTALEASYQAMLERHKAELSAAEPPPESESDGKETKSSRKRSKADKDD